MKEGIGVKQYGQVGAMLGGQDAPKWRCEYLVEKNWKASDLTHQAGDREVIQGVGNVLLNGGADIVWERLTTPAASTAVNVALSAFSTLSFIGVGGSTETAAAAQTALQHSSNVAYAAMEAGYPAHTTGTSTAARTCSFRSVFTSVYANYAWEEWGIFNSTAAAGRMLNRKQQSLGTKTSAAQWTFTATLTLS